MATFELIDTTEMYLKTIFEMEEDGVTPLRARIVERLGHSGPTVSQTIARMERDGLVVVREDRQLELTEVGQDIALQVMKKHRLAERLLVDVIGLPWPEAHEEACRWEHVMSTAVEDRLEEMLDHPDVDPYGNPLPGRTGTVPGEQSLEDALVPGELVEASITRIGEPIQAEPWLLQQLLDRSLTPGSSVKLQVSPEEDILIYGTDSDDPLRLESRFSNHLFVVGR